MKVGIFGQPGSGKTTLWCLVTDELDGPDPAQLGKVQLRTVKVRDPRLERLRDDYQPKKFSPATVEVADFPGGGGIERDRAGMAQLLAPARNMDALILVLRGFEGAGAADPIGDWREIQSEFLLGDLGIIEKRVDKLRVQVKKPTPTQERDRKELELLERLLPHLESERPLTEFQFSTTEEKTVSSFQFLSAKPNVLVLNRGETPPAADELEALAKTIGRRVFPVAVRNELEILQLAPEDREAFRQEFGIGAGTTDQIIAECYRAAKRISFFTVGEKEVRAWTIRNPESAVEAAEEIHSDIARGFIRAETVSYDDYVRFGGVKGAREHGHFRLEGKDYIVADGDLIEFRFSV